MSSDHLNIDDELIAAYLAGEASAEDRQVVEQWIHQSEANKQYFDRLRILWKNTGRITSSDPADVDIDEAWLKFKSNRSRNVAGKFKIRTLLPYFGRVAAALVLCVGIYIVYQYLVQSPAAKEVIFLSKDSTRSETLPDGSHVAINTHSQLIFDENFSEKERVVRLKGEAFFNVVKNKHKPFVVKTNGVVVKVLGTSFYLKDYDSLGVIEVGVEEGIVQVTGFGKEIVLRAGEHVSIDKYQQELNQAEPYNPNDVYWMSKTMVFENQSLATVFSTLEKAYNITVEVENSQILNCRLTGKFYKESVNHIFEIIDTNFQLESVQKEGHFIISGNGCN